ncbi:hypothetical protein BJ912DRAFT_982421 [Pholiota molesta]|nr:hypothetical protein BJ912DRAFT_982421 [Pholiota molesta]
MGSSAANTAISLSGSPSDDVHSILTRRMSSASDAARKLDENRLRLARTSAHTPTGSPYSVPREPLESYSTNAPAAVYPSSSASAAAALLESTANRLRLQGSNGRASESSLQVALPPGRTTWTYPKPFVPNGRLAPTITPDFSWVMTGGNAWSNKHRQIKSPSTAFFTTSRLARERIHWMFPENRDYRVADMLTWVQKMSTNLGKLGVIKFLESRERGAFFINAAFRLYQRSNEPELDWLTFDQLQGTKDKTLQESTAFYNPARVVVVFVYLPSPTGNSMAIWRRKISVPDDAREKYESPIHAVVTKLRSDKDYVVIVDE